MPVRSILSEKHIFGKTTGEVKLTLHSRLELIDDRWWINQIMKATFELDQRKTFIQRYFTKVTNESLKNELSSISRENLL